MASQLASQLAAELDAANLELVQLVRGCSNEQWQTLANDEGDGRPVGVIAHHVGHTHLDTLEWLETALKGDDVTITLDAQAAENARHAATYHDVERQETIRLLEENGKALIDRVAGLSDEQLAGTALHRGAEREMTVEAYARLGHRHLMVHTDTIRKALDLV